MARGRVWAGTPMLTLRASLSAGHLAYVEAAALPSKLMFPFGCRKSSSTEALRDMVACAITKRRLPAPVSIRTPGLAIGHQSKLPMPRRLLAHLDE